MRRADSLLSRAQRRWAWIGFLALALHAPMVAYEMPDDTWILSITVALLVAMIILIDDRRRQRHPVLSQQPADSGPAGE